MAVSTAVVHSVQTIKSDYIGVLGAGSVQLAEVLFTIPTTETYAQADNGILTGVAALISASRRNGKTVNLLGVAPSQSASQDSDRTKFFGLKTVAISSADVTFEVTDNHVTTELAGAAMPAQDRPFGIVVAFYES